MRTAILFGVLALPAALATAADPKLSAAIAADYDQRLAPLFDHFHRHPELSYMEVNTAKRLAAELREAGMTVTEGVGGTGVVALLKNGPGPIVMMRADMDGLPVQEKSGLPNASTVVVTEASGRTVPVSHACGHDVHMTALVGAARRMAAMRSQWSGTLMLIGQPAEERVGGAAAMMKDNLWQRFGKPDYAIALHVASGIATGKMFLDQTPYSGVDTLEILIHGVGAHGGAPHMGKDPVVIGAQIVLALQTIVSRELSPREPGLITVGSFHSGNKSNIISDAATLELSVRSENPATRKLLLDAITRVTQHTARAAGVAEDKLPEIRVTDAPSPPVINDTALMARLRGVWSGQFGAGSLIDFKRHPMVAEDFVQLTSAPYIPSVYYIIGGTPEADMRAAALGGPPVAGNHSPLFKVEPAGAVKYGVATSVLALLELLKK